MVQAGGSVNGIMRSDETGQEHHQHSDHESLMHPEPLRSLNIEVVPDRLEREQSIALRV